MALSSVTAYSSSQSRFVQINPPQKTQLLDQEQDAHANMQIHVPGKMRKPLTSIYLHCSMDGKPSHPESIKVDLQNQLALHFERNTCHDEDHPVGLGRDSLIDPTSQIPKAAVFKMFRHQPESHFVRHENRIDG